AGHGRASQHQASAASSIGPPYTDERGLFAGFAKWARTASSARRCIRSSRAPVENGGRLPSELLGSAKRLGALPPRSTAGQPNSVSRTGFIPGDQGVGVALLTPAGRS